jgi:hypothetical protein
MTTVIPILVEIGALKRLQNETPPSWMLYFPPFWTKPLEVNEP